MKINQLIHIIFSFNMYSKSFNKLFVLMKLYKQCVFLIPLFVLVAKALKPQ